mgnify:CR=1 FL=1
MSALNLVSLLGCAALVALAWLIGGCRRPVPWRTVVGSGALLLAIGALEGHTFEAALEHIAPKGVEENGAIQFEIRAAMSQRDRPISQKPS